MKNIKLNTVFVSITGLVFAAAMAATVIFVNSNMRKQALFEAESKANIILEHNLAIHSYFSHNLKPKIFALIDNIVQEGYFDPTWMSSTYAVREIDKKFKKNNDLTGFYYKEGAINARTPDNEADEYERNFLKDLNADETLELRTGIREINSEPYFYVMHRGEKMNKSCLRCHSEPENAPSGLIKQYGNERSFQREDGEVVSAISIRVPLSAAYKKANYVSARLSLFVFIIMVALFITLILLNRRLIISPLNRIRHKADHISLGAEHFGQEIKLPFGQELQALTTTFNKMSQGLFKDKQLLKENNTKLSMTNKELENEILHRKEIEEELKRHQQHLKELVDERTVELKTAQASLIHAEKLSAIGKLSASIAHEFNNPVCGIRNVLVSIGDKTIDTEDKKEKDAFINMAIRECDRIARLVRSLNDFNRPSDGESITLSYRNYN